jgi:hypothetical protein
LQLDKSEVKSDAMWPVHLITIRFFGCKIQQWGMQLIAAKFDCDFHVMPVD